MAQQENAPNKPVHLMYLVGAVILFYLLQWTIDWVWGYFTPRRRATSRSPSPPPHRRDLIGVITYRNDQYL